MIHIFPCAYKAILTLSDTLTILGDPRMGQGQVNLAKREVTNISMTTTFVTLIEIFKSFPYL